MSLLPVAVVVAKEAICAVVVVVVPVDTALMLSAKTLAVALRLSRFSCLGGGPTRLPLVRVARVLLLREQRQMVIILFLR